MSRLTRTFTLNKNDSVVAHVAKIVFVILLAVAILTFLSSCSSNGSKSGQQKETTTQQSNYDRLVAKDPAHTMAVSPTRNTINKWIDTWGKDPNKLSYVYFENANGVITGYYVLKGLPVSYCTALTPNYQIVQDSHDNGQMSVPAPGIDGVYYSGGECTRYYGFDAATGAYIDFTVGLGINLLIYDQPLTGHPNVPNLAPTGK